MNASLKRSDFFKNLYSVSKGFSTQDRFICEMFSAGGCTFLIPAKDSSNGHGKKIFQGSKISDDVKNAFPSNIDIEKLKIFYSELIKKNNDIDDVLKVLFDKFCFPANTEQDLDLFCIALAKQFAAFITNAPNASDDEADIIFTEYKSLLDNLSRAVSISKTLQKTTDFDSIFIPVTHAEKLTVTNDSLVCLFHLNHANSRFNFDAMESFLVKNIASYVHDRLTIANFENTDDVGTLWTKAVGAFYKASDIDSTWLDDELGNLLVYAFLEQVLGAPKLYSKIELLASGNDQEALTGGSVHLFNSGGDSVPNYQLVFGKANIHNDIRAAIDVAIATAKSVIDKTKKELLLIENTVLATKFSESTADLLANILVPKKSKDRQAQNAFGIFLGYSLSLSNVANSDFRSALTAKMQADIAAHAAYISNKIASANLGGYSFYFYFLPFNDAEIEKKSVMKSILRGGA